MNAHTLRALIFCSAVTVVGLGCSVDHAPLSAPATKPTAAPTSQANGSGSQNSLFKEEMFFADRDNQLTLNHTTLIVPAGALSQNTMISLRITFTGPRRGVINRIYDFGPPLVFNKPVTLILSFAGADLTGVDLSTLSIWYYDETAGAWVNMGGTIDTVGRRAIFIGNLPHFSRYALIGSGSEAPEGDLGP